MRNCHNGDFKIQAPHACHSNVVQRAVQGAGGRVLCPKGCEGRATSTDGAGGCALCAGGSEWCAICAGGHALRAILYAFLYSGGRGGRVPFTRGARVIRYVLERRSASCKCWKLRSM